MTNRWQYPALLTALLLPGVAHAQLTDTLIESELSRWHMYNPESSSFGGGVAFARMDGDYYASLRLKFNFNQENWGFGLQVPVRLRLTNETPPFEEGVNRWFPEQDWRYDDPAFWGQLLRYVYIGQSNKKGSYYVRLGEIANASIGHGTIAHRYTNGLVTNVWRLGVDASVNIGAFGAEVLIGDVFDPLVVGGRLQVRPFTLFGVGGSDNDSEGDSEEHEEKSDSILDRFYVGFTALSDARAPYSLVRDQNGDVQFEENGQYRVDERKAVVAIGGDVGVEVLKTSILVIEPYIDFNKMTVLEDGWGLHIGVLWKLKVPVIIDDLVVDLRTEYRRVGGQYSAPYFDTLYELERYASPLGSVTVQPKLRRLDDGDLGGRNGIYLEALAGLPSWVFLTGEYTDYDGGQADGVLRVGLIVPALDFLKLSAFYYRSGISGLDDLWKLDDRSLLVAEAQVPFYSVFAAQVRFWRTWEATSSGYEAHDDFSVGLGFNVDF